uniref:DUF6538 domain-containing protein n=1 Tax=Halomonas sp. DP5Y7-2 TaxID=2859076 RepID=UPI0039658053
MPTDQNALKPCPTKPGHQSLAYLIGSASAPVCSTCLDPRHGGWYCRVVVPLRARAVIGKTEIRRSLRTTGQCSCSAVCMGAKAPLLTLAIAGEAQKGACQVWPWWGGRISESRGRGRSSRLT